MRSIRSLLTGVVAVAALVTAVAAGPASASAASTPTSVTHTATTTQTPSLDSSYRAPGAVGDCASVRAHLAEYAARGQSRVACLAPAASPTHAAAASPQTSYPVWCASLTANEFWITRTAACEVSGIVYTLVNPNTGAVVGTATFSLAQDIEASTTSLAWTESDYLTLESETGAAAGLSVTWVTACSSPCAPAASEPWKAATPMVLGETLHGTNTLGSTLAAGVLKFLTESYTVTVTQPGTTTTGAATWSAPSVRCDNGVAISGSSGCVEPDFTPVLTISQSTAGASAVMIIWAQTHLSAHWGLQGSGQPLRRLASSTQQAGNRRVICNSTFVNGSTGVPNDSCDEFPFAATYESGALNNVTSGAQCAQVTAIKTASSGSVAAQWGNIAVIGSPTGKENCVRGHIPVSLNSDAGGALGRFTIAQRLNDNDPYWVNVTA